ncbi:MAG: SNF2-related protein [Proteobacteria bacterium]|nr:SNF2-related protein [Pseudomonadota bacterium]
MWRPGQKILHPFNPELGVGVVRAIEDRYLRVYFPTADAELTLAAKGAGLTPLILAPGQRARLLETDEDVVIAEAIDDGYRLQDGREVSDAALWPLDVEDTPVERLAGGRVDSLEAFRNRLAGLELRELREAGGLGSFLGGRIELFPHQLHTALAAVERDPVRWLLADEVGLGKTIEACLILSALIRTGRAERALVVAPSTLTIQWLGELYRKFHQVFVLLDPERVSSVDAVVAEGANAFDAHPFAVTSLDTLLEDERLRADAREAEFDVVVVDEAHRLAADALNDVVAPLVTRSRHALLLTATPLQADRAGFFRLLSLLHPDAFPSFDAFDAAIEGGQAALPCTSAVRRADVGGLPPRVPVPVDVGPPASDWRQDPRVAWLVAEAPGWLARREKALVFVHGRERLESLAKYLEGATRTRVAVFHEDLSVAKRDLAIASFRESAIPVLLASEAGGEGRNFQFCDRMVHFDLPQDPTWLEQRIGRLDRIGRDRPVEIVYFRHEGASPDLARLYERLGLFARPSAGLDAALAGVAARLAEAGPGAELDVEALAEEVATAREALGQDLRDVFYPDAYRPEQAARVLDLVPPELEARTREFCTAAAGDLGFDVVDKGGEARFYVEFGAGAKIDALPGLKGGQRFLGTFDREEAVGVDELDFFASGHPLVEALLSELDDGHRGRAALVELPDDAVDVPGLLAVYEVGPGYAVRVIAADGEPRPDWVAPILAALPRARTGRPAKWGLGSGWADGIRALARHLDAPDGGKLAAVACFRPR